MTVRPVVLLCALALTLATPRGQAQTPWHAARGPLASPYAARVSPENAWPEYPRPQLVRKDWLNLNGLWQYAIRPRDAGAPDSFDGELLVPFPAESALSGVMKPVGPANRLWYRRRFTIPPAWKPRRVWLRFEAVDWLASVRVNGRQLTEHTGGYDPFAFDITAFLEPEGDQELVVGVWDPSDEGHQPRGKQVLKPRGIWYTPTTGIWQTVWLEPVPEASIGGLMLTPDVDAKALTILANGIGTKPDGRVRVVATAAGRVVGTATGPLNAPLVLAFPEIRTWSPDSPFLYDLTVTLLDNGKAVDEVASYFGMRKISLGKDRSGFTRLLLNGQPLFQYGFLDQGFWPEGLHTAPSDDALKSDIEMTRRLGMNLARKHIKIEPDRWYYWADRLGLLVWQDMPSGRNDTDADRRNFESEWQRLIDARRNHPSIVMWVVFNEGWGQYDREGTIRLAEWTSRYDPTRLVNQASGWTDHGAGHVSDVHMYPGPVMPGLEDGRAAVLGEFGGLGLPLKGHTWQDEKNWGYVSYKTPEELEAAYRYRLERLRSLIPCGLSAAVYTQTTDVEIEVNGLMTYDRTLKIPAERLLPLHKPLFDALNKRCGER